MEFIVLVVLTHVIKLLTLDRGCIDFLCVLKGEIKKMGTLKKMGTPKTEKRFPWGPTWPQWIGTRTTVEVGGWMDMTAAQYKGKYLCVHKNHTLCMMGFFYTIRKRMYNTWGSWLGQNGLKKNCLKNAIYTAFRGDTILERPHQRGLGVGPNLF